MVAVSICMTNYNTAEVIRKSLDSVLSLLDGLDFEVVAVDNFSTDGSSEILRDYARAHRNVTVVQKRCLRGMGWQTAFERSSGNLVVFAACDTVYNRHWRELIDLFLRDRYDFGLTAVFTEICPRPLLRAVGGWRNLQYWEDVDLRARLAARGAWRGYPVVCGENLKRIAAVDRFEKAYRLYRRIHDKMLVATWMPVRLYVQGYAASIVQRPGRRKVFRIAYYMPLVLAAIVVSRLRKHAFRREGVDAVILNDSRWFIDLGLVSPEELGTSVSKYDTKEGCEDALRRGDFTFLPGFYD